MAARAAVGVFVCGGIGIRHWLGSTRFANAASAGPAISRRTRPVMLGGAKRLGSTARPFVKHEILELRLQNDTLFRL